MILLFALLSCLFSSTALATIRVPESVYGTLGSGDIEYDEESSLREELNSLLESGELGDEENENAEWYFVGKRKKTPETSEDEVMKPKLVQYPQVLVEVFKTKVNSQGVPTDSILNVTGKDGKRKEFVLVTINGELSHVWGTSTAQSYRQRYHKVKKKNVTPVTTEGTFKPQYLVLNHWSDPYEAWMPHTVFFNGGIALHATNASHIRELGTKDSGGCTRLHPKNAQILWNYINPYNATIFAGDRLSEIRNRVTIKVYGFDTFSGVDRTGAALRSELATRYSSSLAWIQKQLRADLASYQK